MYRLITALFLSSLVGCTGASHPVDEPKSGPDEWTVPEHVQIIREARAKIAPMEESILLKTTEEYNLAIGRGDWPQWAKRCLAYREVFEETEELTLYPAAFIAGFAMHESAGCDMTASDWAGGRGLMQLTNIDQRRHVDPIAKMLGVKPSDVHYHTEPLHNVLVGVAVLDDYERRLHSRPHGILAYNMGVGGVKRAARKAGWRQGPLPEIVELKPHLRHDRTMKPRSYVQKILAAVIMMDQAMHEEPIERREDGLFESSDIPGWDPKDDGADFVRAN